MRISGVRLHASRRRFGRSVAAAGAAILLGGFVAATVSATAAAHSCDAGTFCAYDTNSCGTHAQTHEIFGGQSDNWPGNIDDDEDCVRNRESTQVRVYDSIDFSDFHYCINPGNIVTLPTDKDGDGNSHLVQGSNPASCF